MKPRPDQLASLCPGVDPALVSVHCARLEPRYFHCFSQEQVCRHIAALSMLTPDHPVGILVDDAPDGATALTVLAFDYTFEFSLITGVLAGAGFSIESGDIFTYRAVPAGSAGMEPLSARRRIVDRFVGRIVPPVPRPAWAARLRSALEEVVGLMERGGDDALASARQKVNELVAQRLADIQMDARAVLLPVQIKIDNDAPSFTRLHVVAQDTPAFLYTLVNALALRGVRIEHVTIRTTGPRVEDDMDVTDARGDKIEDPALLNQIRLSVLLTKQFTYFLVQAPDPYAALCRFEQLVDSILRAPSRGQWLDVLSNPHALQDLARVLGASDFLWEDFIRSQYESLLPMLAPHVEGRSFSGPADSLGQRLREAIADAASFDDQCIRLNAFKDREIFLIDLDHIVDPTLDFRKFAGRLTLLAEHVVAAATDAVFSRLAAKHGRPRTVGGVEARHAVLGLGKFGGAALGYASDIELLFVYGDNGQTDGPRPIDNAEFFHLLAQDTAQFIRAKREGIFHIDLRLRPFGSAGPLASSLEQFCQYYGPAGPALAYERLALVRLRTIAGDPGLGAQIERLRDEFIYAAQSINGAELHALRNKQWDEMTKGGQLNAKFSPGGLVDLEYDVQLLQVLNGGANPALRTPRIHTALEALGRAGVLSPDESSRLASAYDFLRRLINSMRMLRDSARDLFLPQADSDEFLHLARRMGYAKAGALDPARQLHVDFETHTAVVRAFVARHFGREALPGPTAGTVADVVLDGGMEPAVRARILSAAGFRDPDRAGRNLDDLAGSGRSRATFSRLAVLASDNLKRSPDPDMALNNWERFVQALPGRDAHFDLLLSQPARLDILLTIFAGSQFLATTLVRTPEFFEWVTAPETLNPVRTTDAVALDLAHARRGAADHAAWRNALRRIRRRELLRIGTRDMWLGAPLEETVREITAVAEAITAAALDACWDELGTARVDGVDEPRRHLCLLAFGKLGGAELNYSSDIDLMGLADDIEFTATLADGRVLTHKELYGRVLEHLREDLSSHTDEGSAYRVDFRLRPYGGSGELTPNVAALDAYYRTTAALWEIQAALKLRPIAGNPHIGHYFLSMLRAVMVRPRSRKDIAESIASMRSAAVQHYAADAGHEADIKNGPGGIRDIEFLVQGLQLAHAASCPAVLAANTLDALDALRDHGIMAAPQAGRLRDDYIFLRRIEHLLQILEDRQSHALPARDDERTALARRLMGPSASSDQLMDAVAECTGRVRKAFGEFIADR